MQKINSVNFKVVIIATVVNFILGFLWYSPVLFGIEWAAELSIALPDMPPVSSIIGSFLFTFLAMWGIAYALKMIGRKGAKAGALISLFLSIVVVTPNLIGQWFFAGKPLLFIINFSFVLVVYLLCGLIIGQFQK